MVVRTLRIVTILFLFQPGVSAQTSGHWQDPSHHRVIFVPVGEGISLEVLDWGGSGQPVVLLAGLGSTAHVFDDFAPKLATRCHVYGITRRGYGASSRPLSGYDEEQLANDDLRVFVALKLKTPVVAGHSVAGNELSQLGIHFPDRVAGLVYLDALNDGSDDYSDYDALTAKLPQRMRMPPVVSAADTKNFSAFQQWKTRTDGVIYPEAELRSKYRENADGSVGDEITPDFVSDSIMAGDHKHDYSQIKVPVLAFVGFPKPALEQIREGNITDPSEKEILEAVFGTYVGMTKNRIKRINSASGGARAVELWGASHFVFLSNADEVLRQIQIFIGGLH